VKFFTRPARYLKVMPSEGEREQLLGALTRMRPFLAPCAEKPTREGKKKGFRSFASDERVVVGTLDAAAATLAAHILRLHTAVDTLERRGDLRRPDATARAGR
jgi:hypothetical protein